MFAHAACSFDVCVCEDVFVCVCVRERERERGSERERECVSEMREFGDSRSAGGQLGG